MLTLRMAVAALVVLTACGRSASDQAAASRASETREIAGASQPSLVDTAAVTPRPALTPRSQTPTHRIQRSRPRNSTPIPATDSEPATSVGPQPTESAAQQAAESVAPQASESVATRSDTVGYRSYAATDSAPAAPAAAVVAAGTVIHVSLNDSISSRLDTFGKQITGRVMDEVTGRNGEVLVEAGAPLHLTVTRLRPGRGSGKGDLEIRPDSITIDGHPRPLTGKIGAVPYELKGRGVTGGDAAKVGVGAVGGAVAGRVITGKTKGAIIGGVIGAAGGAAVATQTAAKDVVVTARTPVDVVLSAPLVIR